MAQTAENLRTIDDYMRLAYRMEVYWDWDYRAAESPDLPGLVAGHETWQGLLAAVGDAKRAWIESALAHGDRIPQPRSPAPSSGKLVLRLPKSLHALAAKAAQREGVSLNTLLVAAIAKELGRKSS